MKTALLLLGLWLCYFTVQPQSINGVPTQNVTGNGAPANCANFPCTVYSSSSNNQTAAICCPPIYTAPVAGTYQLICTDYIVTAGTAGTTQCGFNWKTFTGQPANSAGASVSQNMTTAGLVTQLTISAHLDSTDPVSIFANYTGTTGTPVYSIDWTIKRLQ